MENTEVKAKIEWGVVFKLGLILFVISAVAACLLALTNYVTEGTIAAMNEQSNIEARQEVLPEATSFEAVSEADLADIISAAGIASADELPEAYVGMNGSEIVGYTFKTIPGTGFSGDIEMLTGIAADGTISGITILTMNETPGLGANATNPEFKDQYQGLSATEEVAVSKTGVSGNEIQAMTGATITSKAVTDGVNIASAAYQQLVK
ncbi:MAG: H+/Na+-translocating ferredoxin:NAD+ oxidoreductase subunit [Eubacteriaceae bacterium]|jgi:electron transport complex protein RnfG|nr:H+/Na+-translocating ferredoxin:NAD+ oxidoreductase subunit [Eubacteriaceae bacterium]MDN5308314.1 H+/Na+-translocating ferredoxin:NAD+ oxidoreductase subunit [Eubacteriaceae bacterium]